MAGGRMPQFDSNARPRLDGECRSRRLAGESKSLSRLGLQLLLRAEGQRCEA